MQTLTLSSAGEITLPEDVLCHLGVGAGGKINLDLLPNGRAELRSAPTGKISDVFGMLYQEGRPEVTIEEMNEVIKKGWAGEL